MITRFFCLLTGVILSFFDISGFPKSKSHSPFLKKVYDIIYWWRNSSIPLESLQINSHWRLPTTVTWACFPLTISTSFSRLQVGTSCWRAPQTEDLTSLISESMVLIPGCTFELPGYLSQINPKDPLKYSNSTICFNLDSCYSTSLFSLLLAWFP